MTVESNYVIAIATLDDWLKRRASFSTNEKQNQKQKAPCTRDFSCPLSEFQVIARNCDWFIALFAPVVIIRSNYFGFGLFCSHLKTVLNDCRIKLRDCHCYA